MVYSGQSGVSGCAYGDGDLESMATSDHQVNGQFFMEYGINVPHNVVRMALPAQSHCIFSPNSLNLAFRAPLIWARFPTRRDVQLTENNVQAHSGACLKCM